MFSEPDRRSTRSSYGVKAGNKTPLLPRNSICVQALFTLRLSLLCSNGNSWIHKRRFTRTMQMKKTTTSSSFNNAPLSIYYYRIVLLILIETGRLARKKFKT
uniref:Uncharacterized protein n=1 Tax=Helianthus annuus TaxID=4232 RepID=A0A251S732_HELAN